MARAGEGARCLQCSFAAALVSIQVSTCAKTAFAGFPLMILSQQTRARMECCASESELLSWRVAISPICLLSVLSAFIAADCPLLL